MTAIDSDRWLDDFSEAFARAWTGDDYEEFRHVRAMLRARVKTVLEHTEYDVFMRRERTTQPTSAKGGE